MRSWADVYIQLGITPEDRAFARRLASPPVSARPVHFSATQLRFIMQKIAYDSARLEGADPWDRWDLHTQALEDAYTLGRKRKPITMYEFFKWHSAILPFGGSLRQNEPASLQMGESFRPAPAHLLPGLINALVLTTWRIVLASREESLKALATLHFRQWQLHPFADGNKRHCRLMTVYGCGWYGIAPVNITLQHKSTYLDALRDADITALAALFRTCQVNAPATSQGSQGA